MTTAPPFAICATIPGCQDNFEKQDYLIIKNTEDILFGTGIGCQHDCSRDARDARDGTAPEQSL
jgi:hypothetical protein